MKNQLIDSHTVVTDRQANRTILNELKISFKEVQNPRTGTGYLKLFLTESQDHDETIEELNRWRVQSFIDRVLLN